MSESETISCTWHAHTTQVRAPHTTAEPLIERSSATEIPLGQSPCGQSVIPVVDVVPGTNPEGSKTAVRSVLPLKGSSCTSTTPLKRFFTRPVYDYPSQKLNGRHSNDSQVAARNERVISVADVVPCPRRSKTTPPRSSTVNIRPAS